MAIVASYPFSILKHSIHMRILFPGKRFHMLISCIETLVEFATEEARKNGLLALEQAEGS